jgi:hypothetical protein
LRRIALSVTIDYCAVTDIIMNGEA